MLLSAKGIGHKLLGGGGRKGSDICPHEKPKKFDPPQTLSKKSVTLPIKTIQKKLTSPRGPVAVSL